MKVFLAILFLIVFGAISVVWTGSAESLEIFSFEINTPKSSLKYLSYYSSKSSCFLGNYYLVQGCTKFIVICSVGLSFRS